MTPIVGQLVGEASNRPADGGVAPRGRGPAATLAGEPVGSWSEAARTITIAGAKGGQGTSTVAAVLAIFAAGHQPTQLVSADGAAILGVADAPGTSSVAIVPGLTLATVGGGGPISILDSGPADGGTSGGATFTVVRGPCYLALRAMLHDAGTPPDGIILVVEDGRSLTQRDVEDVTGAPVVARVAHTARVARVIDAGLLIARLHHLTEFGELRRLARRVFGPGPAEGRAH